MRKERVSASCFRHSSRRTPDDTERHSINTLADQPNRVTDPALHGSEPEAMPVSANGKSGRVPRQQLNLARGPHDKEHASR